MSKTSPSASPSQNRTMTSRRKTRKNNNRFETLAEAAEESKDPETNDPSIVTAANEDPEPAHTKSTDPFDHQTKTDDRLDHLESTMGEIANALVIIHDSIENIRSRQNDPDKNTSIPTFDPNQPSSTIPIIDPHQASVNTPLTNPTTCQTTPILQPVPTAHPPVLNPSIPPPQVPNPIPSVPVPQAHSHQAAPFPQVHSHQSVPVPQVHPHTSVPAPQVPSQQVQPPLPNNTIPNPTAPSTQTASAISSHPSHKYWKIARDDNFEPHRFQTYIKDLKLVDDSLHSIRLFYSKIRLAMHTSFKKHTDILPNFDSLTTHTNFTNLLIPSNDQYFGYTTILSVYQWFSDAIYNLLLDPEVINNKRTPRTHQIIIINGNVNNGWQLLFHLLSKRCPFLGGKTIDVVSEITFLKIHQTDTIHTFFKRVQDIETKLLYS